MALVCFGSWRQPLDEPEGPSSEKRSLFSSSRPTFPLQRKMSRLSLSLSPMKPHHFTSLRNMFFVSPYLIPLGRSCPRFESSPFEADGVKEI